MALLVETLKDPEIGTIGRLIVITSHEDWLSFQKVIQQGTNLWPDAPAKIKAFADVVTVGHVQQNYRDDPKKECKHNWKFTGRNTADDTYMYACLKCDKTEIQTLPKNIQDL